MRDLHAQKATLPSPASLLFALDSEHFRSGKVAGSDVTQLCELYRESSRELQLAQLVVPRDALGSGDRMMNRMRKSSSSGTSKKPSAAPASTAFYEELFNKFKEKEEESIGPGGVESLCKAIEVDPSDVLMLVMAWCLGTSQMGYFSREEWQSGLHKLGSVTTEAELKERLEDIHKSTLRDPDALRELHIFAHKFCREERKKNIDVRCQSCVSSCTARPPALLPTHLLRTHHVPARLEGSLRRDAPSPAGVRHR